MIQLIISLLRDTFRLMKYNPLVVIVAWFNGDWVQQQYRMMKEENHDHQD